MKNDKNNANGSLLTLRCSELWRSNQCQEAIELLAQTMGANNDHHVFFLRGRTFELMEQPFEAVQNYTEAIKLEPNQYEYYWTRGCVLSHQLGKDSEAIADFLDAIRLNPDHFESHQQCCLCLLALAKPKEALEHATEAKRLAPNDGTTHFCLGETYARLHQNDEAIKSFRLATELQPDDAVNWGSFGFALYKSSDQNNLKIAIDAYSKAISLEPDNETFRFIRGQLFRKVPLDAELVQRYGDLRSSGQYQETVNLLTQAIETHLNPILYFARAVNFELMGQFPKAMEDYSKAIELDPSNSTYHWNHGYLMFDPFERYAEAVNDLENAIRWDPNCFKAHHLCCLCLLILEKHEEALKHAKAAESLAPKDGSVHFYLGLIYLCLNQNDKAIESLLQATKLQPDKAYYWARLGFAHSNADDLESLKSSMDAYSKAVDLEPNKASHRLERGQFYLHLGALKMAKEDLSRALELSTNNNELLEISNSLTRANILLEESPHDN